MFWYTRLTNFNILDIFLNPELESSKKMLYSNSSPTNYNRTETAQSPLEIVLLAVEIMITILTVCLNLMLILILQFLIKKKTYSNFLLLSLAIADFFIGLISLPSMTVFSWFKYWPFDYLTCLLWTANDYSSSTVSILNLLLIAAQRFQHLACPLRTTENLTKPKYFLVFMIWLVTYFCWTLSIILKSGHGYDYYSCDFNFTFVYVLLADLFGFVFPTVLLLLLNILTILALRKKSKISSLLTGSLSRIQSQNQIMNQKFNTSRDKHAYLFIFSISTNLVLCWIIFFVTWPITAYCSACIDPMLLEIGYWLTYLPSTLNPIIMLYFNRQFLIELKKFIDKFIKTKAYF